MKKSGPTLIDALVKRAKAKRRKDPARAVLEAFVGCIDATGGVVVTHNKRGRVYEPVGDREWIDLGGVYATACHVLRHPMKLVGNDSEEG